jgi:hypothetical protein
MTWARPGPMTESLKGTGQKSITHSYSLACILMQVLCITRPPLSISWLCVCVSAVIIYSAPHLIRRPFADKLPVMERLLCVCSFSLSLAVIASTVKYYDSARLCRGRAGGCSGAGKKRRWRTRERRASPAAPPVLSLERARDLL